MVNYQKQIIYVTQVQYDFLLAGGSITKDGISYTINTPNTTYFVRSTPKSYLLQWNDDVQGIEITENGVVQGSPLTINQASYAVLAGNANEAEHATYATEAGKARTLENILSQDKIEILEGKLSQYQINDEENYQETTLKWGQLQLTNWTDNNIHRKIYLTTEGSGDEAGLFAGSGSVIATYNVWSGGETVYEYANKALKINTYTKELDIEYDYKVNMGFLQVDRTDIISTDNEYNRIYIGDDYVGIESGADDNNIGRLEIWRDYILTNKPFITAKYTSNNRPNFSPSTAIGAMIYDTTLEKPLWWTGTVWKDIDTTYGAATSNVLGLIKAKAKTTETIEAAIGPDNKLYVPTYPDTSNMVTKSDDQTITGIKTFTKDISIGEDSPLWVLDGINPLEFIVSSGDGLRTYKFPKDRSGILSANTVALVGDIPEVSQTAEKVQNTFTVKLDSGSTEGTDLYTFDGSLAKTINFKGGNNVLLTKTAGEVVFSSPSLGLGTTSGSGNAVTDITVDGHTITLTKGSTFLTGNQSITLSGDITGTGSTTITTTLKNSGVTAGSYTAANITVDAQGRVTTASSAIIPATNIIPTQTTANKILLSTTTSGTAKWSDSVIGTAAYKGVKDNTNATAPNSLGIDLITERTLYNAIGVTGGAAAYSHTHNYAASSTVGGGATKVSTTQKSNSTTYQIPFVASVTAGDQYLHTDSLAQLTYNPNTNTLTTTNINATTFTGALGEAYLTWGGKNFSGNYSPFDAAMVGNLGANRFAFGKAENIEVEYSRDNGATWVDYEANDTAKINLFNGLGTSLIIGKNTEKNDPTTYQIRITLRTGGYSLYTRLNKFISYLSTEGATGAWCSIQGRIQDDYLNNIDTWTTFVDQQSVSGWAGYNVINYPDGITTFGNNAASQYGQIRFIFGITGFPESRLGNYAGLTISTISGFGGMGWTTPSNLARFNRLYSYDANQNMILPANLRLGQQSNKATIEYTSNTNRTFTLTDVGVNADFVLTAGNQTIDGIKTFKQDIEVGQSSVKWTLDGVDDNVFKIQASGGTTYQLNKNHSAGVGPLTIATLGDIIGGMIVADTLQDFPQEGEPNILYVVKNTDLAYYYDNAYIPLVPALNDISDITLSSPSNNQFLRYNSTSGKWENQTVNIPAGTITGVTATSPVLSSGGAAPVISLAAAYGDTLNPYGVKAKNLVLAGPSSGSDASPTFRELTLNDLPTSSTANRFLKVGTANSIPTYSSISFSDLPTGTGSTQVAVGNHNHSEYLTSHQSLANYVDRSTAQIIAGNKTFTGISILENSAIPFYVKRLNNTSGIYAGGIFEKGTSGTAGVANEGIGFYFKSRDTAGNMDHAGLVGGRLTVATSGSEVGEILLNPAYNNTDPYNRPGMRVRAVSNTIADVYTTGNFYANAGTTGTTGDKVATETWVGNNAVTLTDNQTITGIKTFTSDINIGSATNNWWLDGVNNSYFEIASSSGSTYRFLKGASGVKYVTTKYTTSQNIATGTNTYTINHNLGTEDIVYSIRDSIIASGFIDALVKIVNSNSISITFNNVSTAFTAKIVVIG